MKNYRMSLVISFVLRLKGSTEIDCGLPLSWSWSNAWSNGVKWMSVGNDGIVKMVSLYSIYSYVFI